MCIHPVETSCRDIMDIIYYLFFCVSMVSALADPEIENSGSIIRASDEVRLVQLLLQRYKVMGTVARPTYNSSQITDIEFGMRLIQMDIIEKEQLLKTSVWIRCRWIDEYLQWDPDDYGGIQHTVLPWDKVWTPDIALVNTASTVVDERHSDIMVSYEGAVVWSPQRMFQSACLLDVTNFPYDQHTCHMWFQSMARYRWQLDIMPYSGGSPWDLDTYLASFKQSQEWEVISNFTQRFENSQDVGVLLKFSRRVALRFTLTVKRRLGYTFHLLMMPCVFLGFMTLIVFWLPPERTDRHTLATSLFGSFIVLTLILVEIAPPNSASVPKLGMYYACNMSLVMISIFLSAFVINVSRRGDNGQPVPVIIKLVLVDFLSRVLLCHNRASQSFETYDRKKYQECSSRDVESGDRIESRDHVSNTITDKAAGVLYEFNNRTVLCKSHWTTLAMILDRLFFLLYFCVFVAALLFLFPRQA